LAEGAHSFEVKATDKAGNADATPATFAWSVDTAAPNTAIDQSPPALSASANAEFKFSGTDGAGSGIAAFECRRDGGAWGKCTSPQTYASLAEGAHSFEVKAIDQAGNTDATPATFNWSIDTVAPNTTIDANPPALAASAAASFAFSGSDAGGSGVASFQCRIDAGAWAPCTSPKAYAGLSEGAHSFEVKAIDAAANADATPAAFAWSVDTTAPQTQIDTHPPTLSASAGASFAFSGTDTGGSGIASFECRRDGGAWGSCTSPKAYASLADGAHSFEVKAIDQAANADASAAVFNWDIDTTAPVVSIDSGPSGLTNDATPSFDFHSGEPGSSFACSIDTGTPAYGPCSGAGTHTPSSPLSDGPYTFRVRATDAAANQGTATQTFNVDTAAPGAPQLSATLPASPANENNPKLTGTATAGATVRIYTSADCSGTPAATASAAQLAEGIAVSVPDDSITKFRATATSTVGNPSACSAALTYVEDSSAPNTQIDGNPANPVASANATFVFSGSDGSGSGVASYQCRVDSTQAIDWAPCTTPKPYTGLSDGTHKFEVRAIDQAANADATPATFSWVIDTTAPTTTLDSNPPALSPSAAASFAFSGSDGSGTGLAAFECRRDGGAWSACTSPQSYASLAEGAHSFEVKATDKAGNADATPASFEWSVDTSAPGAPQLTATVPASPANENSPTIVGSAADGSSIRLYEGTSCEGPAIQTTSAAQLEAGIAVSVPDDSTTRFSATATSSASNTSSCSASITYIEDSSAPNTQIDSGPASASIVPMAEFAFSGSDSAGAGVASYQCRIDSTLAGAWQPCTSPESYEALADGAHRFEARAIDHAGNVDGSPAAYIWTIDATLTTPRTDSTAPKTPISVRLQQVKYNAHSGKAVLIFKVSGPGKLSASVPTSTLRQRRSTTVKVARAGLVRLPIKLSPTGRQRLLEGHKVRVRVLISFEAPDESSVSRTVPLVFRKTESKPRKK
jgi:hypothetical protein